MSIADANIYNLFYNEQVLNNTVGGAYSSPVAVTMKLRKEGKVAFISVPTQTSVSNVTSAMIFQQALPASYWPDVAYNFPIWSVTNGSTIAGNATISTSGILTIYLGYNGTFPGNNPNPNGWNAFSICYNTAN